MSRMSRQFTTRRTVLGLPVGKPHTDWAEVRKVGMVGAGAVSTVAGSLRAWSALPPAVKDLPGRLWGRAAGVVSGIVEPGPRSPDERSGGPGGDEAEKPARTASRRPAGARARRDGATRKSGSTGRATRKAGASRRAPAARGKQ